MVKRNKKQVSLLKVGDIFVSPRYEINKLFLEDLVEHSKDNTRYGGFARKVIASGIQPEADTFPHWRNYLDVDHVFAVASGISLEEYHRRRARHV